LQDYGEDQAQYLLENNQARKKDFSNRETKFFSVEQGGFCTQKSESPSLLLELKTSPIFQGK
jgi:hypothetical protein